MKDLLDQEEFFKKYNCREIFNESCLSWEVISAIYEDYIKRFDDLNIVKDNLISVLQREADFPHHSIHGRVKAPEHLIEKIIRKVGIEQSSKYREISVSNYKEIIHAYNWYTHSLFKQGKLGASIFVFGPIAADVGF